MNHTRFPKEKHLPYWARRGNKDKKGDRVEYKCNITLQLHLGLYKYSDTFRDSHTYINPLALELDIYSLAHRLCKMWIFYEPRKLTLGNTRTFVEE